MLGRYSNVFVVDLKAAVDDGKRLRVTDIGQSFELMSVLVEGGSGCAVQVFNGTVSAASVGPEGPEIYPAASTFSANAVIEIEVTGAPMRRCQLLCRAVDAKARPVKVEVV